MERVTNKRIQILLLKEENIILITVGNERKYQCHLFGHIKCCIRQLPLISFLFFNKSMIIDGAQTNFIKKQ